MAHSPPSSHARALALAAGALLLVAGGIALVLVTGSSGERAAAPAHLAPGQDSGGEEATHPTAAARVDGARRHERSAIAEAPRGDGPSPEGAAAEEPFDPRVLRAAVVDPEGRPVAGARVLRFPAIPTRSPGPHLEAPAGEAETDAAGRFRFEDLEPRARIPLLVVAEGFLPRPDFRASVGRTIRIELERAQPFAGRVLDARTRLPMAGIEVVLDEGSWDGERYHGEAAVTTDALGRFAFEQGRIGEPQGLALRRPGALPADRRVRLVPGVTEGYDVLLPYLRRVVLELADATSGAPLADLDVELHPGGARRTDAHGRIELEALDLPWYGDQEIRWQAWAEGWCRTSLRTPRPAAEGELAAAIPLVRAGRIELSIRDAEGSPLEGVPWWPSWRGSVDLPPLPEGARIEEAPLMRRSDAQGILRVDAPPGQGFVLRFDARGAAPLQLQVTAPEAGATVRRAVVLQRGATIEGLVTRHGEPSARAVVNWRSADGTLWGHDSARDDGSFLLENVSPGRVRLHAYEEHGFSSSDSIEDAQELDVVDGERISHDLRIDDERAPIEGRVRDSAGLPLAGVSLLARWSGFGPDRKLSVRHGRGTSGADGRFSIDVRAEEGVLYTVNAHLENGARQTHVQGVAPGTKDLEIVFPRRGTLRLRVVDAEDQAPIEGFELFFRRAGEAEFEVVVDELAPGPDGAFHVRLPEGRVDLRVSARAAGYVAGVLDAVLIDPEAEPREWTVALEKGCTLELRFEPWQPGWAERLGPCLLVPPERAAALDGDDDFHDHEGWRFDRLRPDAEGRCVLTGVAPGPHVFWQPPSGVLLDPARIDVPRARRHGVVVRWIEDER